MILNVKLTVKTASDVLLLNIQPIIDTDSKLGPVPFHWSGPAASSSTGTTKTYEVGFMGTLNPLNQDQGLIKFYRIKSNRMESNLIQSNFWTALVNGNLQCFFLVIPFGF